VLIYEEGMIVPEDAQKLSLITLGKFLRVNGKEKVIVTPVELPHGLNGDS